MDTVSDQRVRSPRGSRFSGNTAGIREQGNERLVSMPGEGMNPETEKGLKSGVLDRVIDAVHDEGKQILLISANLPYDAARYEEADAVLLSYSSSPMPALPEGKNASSVNIPAALCGAFGAYSFSGILPVNIPKMGGDYTFTEETLYERGTIRSTTPASVPRAS